MYGGGLFFIFLYFLCGTGIAFLLCAEKSWTPHMYTPPRLVINTQAAGCPPAVLVENDPQGCNSRFGYCSNAKALFCSCKWGGSVLEEALHTKGKPIENHATPVSSRRYLFILILCSPFPEVQCELDHYIDTHTVWIWVCIYTQTRDGKRDLQTPCATSIIKNKISFFPTQT